jgi:hypothetical protein
MEEITFRYMVGDQSTDVLRVGDRLSQDGGIPTEVKEIKVMPNYGLCVLFSNGVILEWDYIIARLGNSIEIVRDQDCSECPMWDRDDPEQVVTCAHCQARACMI